MNRPDATFLGLVAGEVTKLLGRRWLVAAAFAPAVIVAIKMFFTARVAPVQQALAGQRVDEPIVSTAFQSAAAALGTGAFISALLVGIVAAVSLAEERRLGTLRTLLAGPVRRWRFFAAKLFGILVLSVLLVGSATVAAVVAGSVVGDYVALDDWEYADVKTVGDAWRLFWLAAALSCAGVFAVGCLGMLSSAATSSGVASLIVFLLTVVTLQFAPTPFDASTREIWKALTPLTYVDHPSEFVAQQINGITSSSWCVIPLRGREAFEPWLPWIVCVVSTTLLGGLGLGIFARRQVL